MTHDIQQIINNVKEIYMSDSSLNTLLSFERVLSELDLYVFANWKQGELVSGPIYEKYWVKTTWMWPQKLMPDPSGGARLLDYDCVVKYKLSKLTRPKKVQSPDDFVPGTHYAKTTSHKVWLVEITMPKQLMTDIARGSIELENETVDMEDIDQAYDTGVDQDAANGSTSTSDNGGDQQESGGFGGF